VTESSLRIVGIGGTTNANSATERALAAALQACERLGASTRLINGAVLAQLPMYLPEVKSRLAVQTEFSEAVRVADAVILATPAYHAGVSALVKNALDLLEDLRADARPYLTGRAVGLIVTAHGWQGTGTTLTSMRSIVHALRGWPTPLGVTMNVSVPLFDAGGQCTDEKLTAQLNELALQVVDFARRFSSRETR
jgi:FMN reductase